MIAADDLFRQALASLPTPVIGPEFRYYLETGNDCCEMVCGASHSQPVLKGCGNMPVMIAAIEDECGGIEIETLGRN